MIVILGLILIIIGLLIGMASIAFDEIFSGILAFLVIVPGLILIFVKPSKEIPKPVTHTIDKGYYYHMEQDSEVIVYPDSLFTIQHR